jgi:hypothetical protein
LFFPPFFLEPAILQETHLGVLKTISPQTPVITKQGTRSKGSPLQKSSENERRMGEVP